MKKAKKPLEFTEEERIKLIKKIMIPTIRRATYRWPYRTEAIKRARISRGLYVCRFCSKQMKNGEYTADHNNPMVTLSGFDDWNGVIDRALCSVDNWNILCHDCHDLKTSQETVVRKIKRTKKAKKKR